MDFRVKNNDGSWSIEPLNGNGVVFAVSSEVCDKQDEIEETTIFMYNQINSDKYLNDNI